VFNKHLKTIEFLELKSDKFNYKIIYIDSSTNLTVKFVVFFDPKIQKILLLNSISLQSSQRFEELSEAEKNKDKSLTDALRLLNNLHSK
jgi:hypothetical protein